MVFEPCQRRIIYVELEIVDAMSYETVRRTLKKTR